MTDPRDDDVTAADAAAPTEVMEPISVDDTAVMDGLPPVVAPAGPDDDEPADIDAIAEDEAEPSRSWMGVVAFLTGAIGLWIVAIPLGHAGIVAVRRGRATTRGFAVAGTILGYVGLALTAVLVWFLLRGPQPETLDAYAHHDVVEVGNAVASAVEQDESLPIVEVAGEGYAVAGTQVAGLLETQRSVALTPVGDEGWCLELDYVGGMEGSWSFHFADGVTKGGTCAAA